MSAGRDEVLNVVMGYFMTGVYLGLPAACAAAVGYDFWHNGLSSLPIQFGLAIFGLFAAVRLISYAFAAADIVADAARSGIPVMTASIERMRTRLVDAVRLRGIRHLSQA